MIFMALFFPGDTPCAAKVMPTVCCEQVPCLGRWGLLFSAQLSAGRKLLRGSSPGLRDRGVTAALRANSHF